MVFKDMSKDNIRELSQLYVKSFNAPPWNDKWSEEDAAIRLSQMIDKIGFYGITYYENDKLIGMILGHSEHYYDGTYFEIKEFCVDSNRSGKGIGSLILNTFLENLKIMGIRKVFLLTCRTLKTEGFYKKNGFKSVEEMVMMNKEIII